MNYSKELVLVAVLLFGFLSYGIYSKYDGGIKLKLEGGNIEIDVNGKPAQLNPLPEQKME